MHKLIILILLFPLISLGQVFETFIGPPIYISKKYIQDHKIQCLTFSETRGHLKHKHYSSAAYNLIFDSSGTLIKMKSFDSLMLSEEPVLYLMDRIDTSNAKKYDTIVYDENKNLIKMILQGNKNYYTYDHENRLCQKINIIPQANSNPVFHKTQFIYSNEGVLIELITKEGKLNDNRLDSTVYVHINYLYNYKSNLLTSIQYSSYRNSKIDDSYKINVEYINGIISKIVRTNKKQKDYLKISINLCE